MVCRQDFHLAEQRHADPVGHQAVAGIEVLEGVVVEGNEPFHGFMMAAGDGQVVPEFGQSQDRTGARAQGGGHQSRCLLWKPS